MGHERADGGEDLDGHLASGRSGPACGGIFLSLPGMRSILRRMTTTNAGRYVWFELLTTDPGGAIAFYADVVGWKTEAWAGADYTMWLASQGPVGGVSVLRDGKFVDGVFPGVGLLAK